MSKKLTRSLSYAATAFAVLAFLCAIVKRRTAASEGNSKIVYAWLTVDH